MHAAAQFRLKISPKHGKRQGMAGCAHAIDSILLQPFHCSRLNTHIGRVQKNHQVRLEFSERTAGILGDAAAVNGKKIRRGPGCL